MAFCRLDRDGVWKIWTKDLSTQQETLLGPGKNPEWSPTGSRIVFQLPAGRIKSLWSVWTMKPDGTDRTQIYASDESWAIQPTWSPDGRWILFTSWQEGNWDVWAVPSSGGRAVRLTRTPESEFVPRWSPDARRIAFHRTSGAELLLVPFPEGRPERISLPQILRVYQLAFSPDERKLFISGETGYAGRYLWEFSLDDGKLTSLEVRGWTPCSSPDGRRVAFVSYEAGNPDIWTISTSGGRPRQVTIDPSQDIYPSWSPDGSEIAFVSDRGGTWDIWVIPSSGGNPRPVAVGEDYYFLPVWSPDGRWIAFISYPSGEGTPAVRKVRAEGGRSVLVARMDEPSATETPLAIGWSEDGRFLYYLSFSSERGEAHLWKVPASGGKFSPVRSIGPLPGTPSWFGGALYRDAFAVSLPLRADLWTAKLKGR